MAAADASSLTESDGRASARAAGLRYSTDSRPGISRQRSGRGFSYHRADGVLIRDRAVLARLRALAIEAQLDPAFAEKWFNFIVAEVIHHHERIVSTGAITTPAP